MAKVDVIPLYKVGNEQVMCYDSNSNSIIAFNHNKYKIYGYKLSMPMFTLMKTPFFNGHRFKLINLGKSESDERYTFIGKSGNEYIVVNNHGKKSTISTNELVEYLDNNKLNNVVIEINTEISLWDIKINPNAYLKELISSVSSLVVAVDEKIDTLEEKSCDTLNNKNNTVDISNTVICNTLDDENVAVERCNKYSHDKFDIHSELDFYKMMIKCSQVGDRISLPVKILSDLKFQITKILSSNTSGSNITAIVKLNISNDNSGEVTGVMGIERNCDIRQIDILRKLNDENSITDDKIECEYYKWKQTRRFIR